MKLAVLLASRTTEDLWGVTASLLVDSSRQTTIKDRFIAGVQQLLRVDRESVEPVAGDITALETVSSQLANILDWVPANPPRPRVERRKPVQTAPAAAPAPVSSAVAAVGRPAGCPEGEAGCVAAPGARPVASVLRDFSAPVILERKTSAEERAFLLAHDTDPFNKWEAGRALARDGLVQMIRDGAAPDWAAFRKSSSGSRRDG